MSPPAVVLAADDPEVVRLVRAAFEEEAVPLAVVDEADGATAAGRSPLGIGLGQRAGRIELVLAAASSAPYLVGDDARTMGRIAARLAARRPLGDLP